MTEHLAPALDDIPLTPAQDMLAALCSQLGYAQMSVLVDGEPAVAIIAVVPDEIGGHGPATYNIEPLFVSTNEALFRHLTPPDDDMTPFREVDGVESPTPDALGDRDPKEGP